jgi:hypothetical protein
VSLLAAQASNNASLVVGINTSAVGNRAGTATIGLTSNGTGTSGLANTTLTPQVINVSGTVYRLAAASSVTPPSMNFGARHVGDVATQALTLTNTAAADTFSEKLDAAFSGTTGNATGNGSISLLAPQASNNTSLVVGIDTTAAGNRAGTATVGLTSNGTGTSGLTNSALTPQVINVSGIVYRLAVPATHTPEPVAFGVKHVGEAAPTQLVTISNSAAADGFSESLNAGISGQTGGVTTNSGVVAALAPGATNATSISVGISTATRGDKSGTATISLTSNGAGSSGLGLSVLTSQTVNVTGQVNEFAQPILFFESGGATLTQNSPTSFTLDFGSKTRNTGPFAASFGVRNTLLDAVFQDALGGTFDTSTVNDFTLGGFTAFSGITPGNSFDPAVTFDTARPTGTYTDSILLTPSSSNASGAVNRPAIQLNIQGQIIAVPEPASLGLLLAAVPLLGRRRRAARQSLLVI